MTFIPHNDPGAVFIGNSDRSPHSLPMRVLSFLALLLCVASAHADAMRCGNRLVGIGDARSAVRQMCGEPSDVQTRTILRRPYYDFQGRLIYYGDGLIEIPVEIWTYNFGPYKLMRRVRFVDGMVEEIETLGYGYHAKPTSEPAAPPDSTPRETYR